MLRTPLVRLFVRATALPMALTAALALLLLGLGALGQACLALSVAPSPALLARMAIGVFGSVAPVAVGVGVLGGLARGVARLQEERALVALAAAGLRPSRIAVLAAALTLPGVGLHLALAHFGEPWARALVRDSRVAAASAITPTEARPVRLGTWWVARDGAALVYTDGTRTGRADTWALTPTRGGVLAELGGVTAELGGARLQAAALALPIPVDARGKVHIFERDTPDLLRQIAASARLGRERYERWTLWKRTLLPALLLPLGVAAAGFARRRAEGPVVGALVVGTWVAVRLLDTHLDAVGLVPAAALLVGASGAAALAGWVAPVRR